MERIRLVVICYEKEGHRFNVTAFIEKIDIKCIFYQHEACRIGM